jgi:hypothetical protein
MCKITNCANDGEPMCEKHLNNMRRQNAREGSRVGEYRRDLWD